MHDINCQHHYCHCKNEINSHHKVPWISLLLPIFLIIVMSIFWIYSFPITSSSSFSSSSSSLSPSQPSKESAKLIITSNLQSIDNTSSSSSSAKLTTALNLFQSSPIESPQSSGLSVLIMKRMKTIARLIRTGDDVLPPNDPMILDSFWLSNSDLNGYDSSNIKNLILNVTFDRVQINGLSTFAVKDIATNSVARSVSVLVQFKELTITGFYNIIFGQNEKDKIISDVGKIRIKIVHLYSSWFARLALINDDEDILTVYQPFLKSFFDDANLSHEFISSKYNQWPHKWAQTMSSIVPIMIKRLRNMMDTRLMDIFSVAFKEQSADEIDYLIANQANNHNLNHHLLSRQRRQVPCKAGKDLDEYVDSLFRFLGRILTVMEPFSMPNATIYLPEYNLKIFLYEGGARRAYTLQRAKSAWVFCSNESVSLGLTVGFDRLRINYKYRAIHDWKLLWDGDFEVDLDGSRSQLQFTQTTPANQGEKPQQRVDRLRIWRLGKIGIIIRGLGNLTQGVALWLSQILNDPKNQKQFEPTIRRLEAEFLTTANVMLANVSLPSFNIL